MIVTKDDDFQGLLNVLGHPPKVVRLRMGNCSNHAIISALIRQFSAIASTLAEPAVGLVELYE